MVMVVPCPTCGHSLWAEVRGVGVFDFVVYFDDDERSNFYAVPVTSCPTCHKWFDPLVDDPARGQRYASRRA